MRVLTPILTALCLLCLGCSIDPEGKQNELKRWMEPSGKVKVLSSTAMVNDLVQQVGGEWVQGITLIQGDLDPHSYQLVKGDDEKLQTADIIFSNGLGLEHGPSLSRFLLDSSKAIPLGDRIAHENPGLIIVHEGQLDPHIWMDISLFTRAIPFIVKGLSERDPEHSADFLRNAERLQKEMTQKHLAIRDQLQRIPEKQRYLITSHDAFNYFTRAYLAAPNETDYVSWSLRFAAPEGLAPDSQLSSTDIQKIIDHLRLVQVHVIFPETNVSRDSIRKIVQAGEENGLQLIISETPLYGDAMGRPGTDGDTYLKMIQHNADALTKYLGKRQ